MFSIEGADTYLSRYFFFSKLFWRFENVYIVDDLIATEIMQNWKLKELSLKSNFPN